MNVACCHFSDRICFLDHLIPFCHLFDAPLITNNQELLLVLEKYYPATKSILTDNIEKSLEPYSTLFYAQPSRLFPYGFDFSNHYFPHKKRSVFTYHGFSEKYRDDFWLERFIDEDLVLIHGNLMKKILKKKGIWDKIKSPIICGNLRLEFYQKHRDFFKKKVEDFLPHSSKKTILLAPSCNLGNFSTKASFSFLEKIINTLPDEYQLWIKPHPLEKELWESIKKSISHPFVFFIDNCPLIYPILEKTDLLLADVSSVAYDFLAFNRPMIFFKTAKAPLLHRLGRVLENNESLFDMVEEKELDIYHKRRKIWVNKIFSPIKEEECKQSIFEALK